jgi:ribonuclease T1
VVIRVPPPADGSRPKVTSAVALLLVVAVAVGIWLVSGRDPGTPTGTPDPSSSASAGVSGLPLVDLDDLPPEAAETLELIDAGGPFPYPRSDGATFENREGLLPERQRGYYAEYTVPTPGSDDRGPRRLVTGDGGELYWTADHYASFEEVVR